MFDPVGIESGTVFQKQVFIATGRRMETAFRKSKSLWLRLLVAGDSAGL
jgi:hypothetical protein